MKKILALAMALTMGLTLVTAQAEAPKKTLVVYFSVAENSDVDATSSASVLVAEDGQSVGPIRSVAEVIHVNTDSDLFAIDTEYAYPGQIDVLIEYAQGEQQRNERPVILNQIENFDEYDTVFIGYPTWWYGLPMVMYSFFEEYDFSGKTIIPFNTHYGSRFSGSIETIAELEPNANVISNGFTVLFSEALEAENDIKNWLNQLSY